MEGLLFKARLANKADQYNEMVLIMKSAAEKFGDQPFSEHARNLLAVAYKNCIAKKRMSWRIVSQIIDIETNRGHKIAAAAASDYRTQIEQEIITLCEEVDDIALDLSVRDSEPLALAFFTKMRGDYQRYIAEFAGERQTHAISEAAKLYDEAMQFGLPANHYISLGIALNRAILHYEVLNRKTQAIEMIKEALDAAQCGVDTNNVSPTVLHLLNDNLKLWEASLEKRKEFESPLTSHLIDEPLINELEELKETEGDMGVIDEPMDTDFQEKQQSLEYIEAKEKEEEDIKRAKTETETKQSIREDDVKRSKTEYDTHENHTRHSADIGMKAFNDEPTTLQEEQKMELQEEKRTGSQEFQEERKIEHHQEGGGGERRNSQGERRNSQGERRNSQGERRNSQGERRNSQGERRTSQEGDRRTSQGERRTSQGERRNSQGERRNSQGERRNSQGERRGSQEERRNSQGERRNSQEGGGERRKSQDDKKITTFKEGETELHDEKKLSEKELMAEEKHEGKDKHE